MENAYHEMREEIIVMQQRLATLDAETKKNHDVIQAANNLYHVRCALEILLMKEIKAPE